MKEYRFTISMTAAEFMPYYEGRINGVVVTTVGGTRIRLQARHLRPFMTQAGIHGLFSLVLDDDNKLVNLQKIQ